MNRFPLFGRYCLATGVAGSGVMQIVNGELVRLGPKLPDWLPAPTAWAMSCGVLLLALGVALAVNFRVRWAVVALSGLLFALFCLKSVPEIVANPRAGFMWTNPAKILALLGGSLLVAWPAGRVPYGWGRAPGVLAPGLLGGFLLICGAQHFIYAEFVDGLVPAWLPPDQRFWTQFSAVALLAGGVGVFLHGTRRWAGRLSGLMIFLWVPSVHIARTLAARNAFELAGVFEALALAGVAWLVAGSAAEKASIPVRE